MSETLGHTSSLIFWLTSGRLDGWAWGKYRLKWLLTQILHSSRWHYVSLSLELCSANWNGFLAKLYILVGDIVLALFWNIAMQIAWRTTSRSVMFWEKKKGHWGWSLCSVAQWRSGWWRVIRSIDIWNTTICGWLNSCIHELVNTQSTWVDGKTSNWKGNICSAQPSLRLSNGESEKCDTWDST